MSKRLRRLAACDRCSRQYDVSGHAVGELFHCLCGRRLAVPRSRPRDAAVVRCSACGGPRQGGARACGYCGADFTLHERDLHTLCPSCMTRISDRARYCHHCATLVAPQPLGEVTSRPCPACGDTAVLTSRRLDEAAVAVLECPRCAGLWLGRKVLGHLLAQARREAPPDGGLHRAPPNPGARQDPAYRPCPDCGQLMHRLNFGRRSGVIVDSCAAHGVWFDAEELARILAWVRAGGERETAERQREEHRLRRRLERLDGAPPEPLPAPARSPLVELLGELAASILG